jgi:hypothetical protein
MKHALLAAVLLAALSTLAPGPAAAAHENIGVVRTSAGSAAITRDGKVLPAPAGTKLLAGDILNTGSDGSIGVILRDNSTLSLGPKSNVVIRDFLFSPAEGKLGLLVRISRGTMAYLSGLIGKLSPESARFETPVATIGIRGTRFAVKVDD